MARPEGDRNRDRIKAMLGVGAFHALLGYGLIAGLGFQVPEQVKDTFKVFDVPQQQPPPPIEEPPPPDIKAEEEEGEASPPNIKSRATPIVVPPPKLRIEVPPKIVAADRPSPAPIGNDPTAGASNVAGSGTGSGGRGAGTGSGGSGTGSGSGGMAARAQRERGALTNDDYMRVARGTRPQGTVHVRYSVGANGRVGGCVVTRSSGHANLDAATCRLIEQRFRYRPARDAQGRSVPDVVTTNFYWGPRP